MIEFLIIMFVMGLLGFFIGRMVVGLTLGLDVDKPRNIPNHDSLEGEVVILKGTIAGILARLNANTNNIDRTDSEWRRSFDKIGNDMRTRNVDDRHFMQSWANQISSIENDIKKIKTELKLS